MILTIIAHFVIAFWYFDALQRWLKQQIAPTWDIKNFCWLLSVIQWGLVLIDARFWSWKAIPLNLALEYGILWRITGKDSLDLYPVSEKGIKGVWAHIGVILLVVICCLIMWL